MRVVSNLEVSERVHAVITRGEAAVNWIQQNRTSLLETMALVAQGFHPYLETLVQFQRLVQQTDLDLNHELLFFLEEAEGMLQEIEGLIDRYAVLEKASAD